MTPKPTSDVKECGGIKRNGCCDECWQYIPEERNCIKCVNPSCSCHSEPKSECMVEEMEFDTHDFQILAPTGKRMCIRCGALPPKPTWEERFDKEFHYKGEGHWFHTVNVSADPEDEDKITGTTDTAWAVPDSIKSFIRSVLEEERKKVKDIIVKLMRKNIARSDEYGLGYDKALIDISQILNESDE